MSDKKFDVIVVGAGLSHRPLIGNAMATLLTERGLVMPADPQLAYSEDVDWKSLTSQLDTIIHVLFRQSFKARHEGRIERYNRRQPRNGRIPLEWNRKIKWQPRFFSAPSRKSHFSQSRLRLSQVQSLGRCTDARLRKACSLDWSVL